jgi:hypothetical protein
MSTAIPCPGCRTLIEPGARFCVECGLCALSVIGERTVVAYVLDYWPPNTPPPGATAPQRVLPCMPARSGYTIRVSAIDEEMELDFDDLLIDDEEPFIFVPPPLPPLVPHRKIFASRRTPLRAVGPM